MISFLFDWRLLLAFHWDGDSGSGEAAPSYR